MSEIRNCKTLLRVTIGYRIVTFYNTYNMIIIKFQHIFIQQAVYSTFDYPLSDLGPQKTFQTIILFNVTILIC